MSPEKFALVFGRGHSFDRVITPETVALIERWELFMPRRYADGQRPDGSTIWSIGFGHAEDGDNEPKKITEDIALTIEQAREILAADINVKARFVNTRVKTSLTTFQFGALTSLTFQYGQGRVDAANTVIPLLNDTNYIKAAVAMLALNKKRDGTDLDGLTVRRASEVGFFMTRK